jgi:hypothetical protein
MTYQQVFFPAFSKKFFRKSKMDIFKNVQFRIPEKSFENMFLNS